MNAGKTLSRSIFEWIGTRRDAMRRSNFIFLAILLSVSGCAALELDIPVWTHTGHQRGNPDSDARLGHPMLVEPVALKYPKLKIILGHCGVPWQWEAWSLVVRHPNVYLDISANPNLYHHLP